MDSLGEKQVCANLYTSNDVRKWGVGLGLDLKGGMNVILQVDMPDMLRSMKAGDTDSTFEAALRGANEMVATHQSEDFVRSFIQLYRQAKPQADFSVVFQDVVSSGASDDAVHSTLKAQVKDRVDNSANQRASQPYRPVRCGISQHPGSPGQGRSDPSRAPGVKDHERVRDLLQRSANLEFYETYTAEELGNAFGALMNRLANDSTVSIAALQNVLARGGYGATVGYAPDAKTMAAVDALLETAAAKNLLPSDLRLRWAVKPTVRQDANGNDQNFGTALYALKANGGKPALDGRAVSDASSNPRPPARLWKFRCA